MSNETALLQVRDLAWTPPGADEPLWRGVSFSLVAGELALLSGPSGSGKSTLLRGMVHLEELTTGAVYLRGTPVTNDTIRAFRNRVVYVQQAPVALAPTVDENMAFAREIGRQFADAPDPMTEEEQRDHLASFGLKDVNFSRRFEDFSLGEQQRLALVRCLTVRPDILLLDEPTASLDDESARRVEAFITERFIADGGAALWVTHGIEQRARLQAREIDIARWTGQGEKS